MIKNLTDIINIACKNVYKKRGFEHVRLISDWKKIVGEDFANSSYPQKLSIYQKAIDGKKTGTLTVEISDSAMALQFSYMEQVIIEKISSYFGYKAIDKIKILQNPKTNNKKNEPFYIEPKLINDTNIMLDTMVDIVDDEQLQKNLKSLGQSVFSQI